MKKISLMVMLLSIIVLSACKGKDVTITADDAKNNEIIVTSKKKIQGVIKESFDKDYYKEKDLEEFIEKDLDDFNKKNDTKISLNSMKVKDKNVYAVLDYDSIPDFNSYNDYELKSLSVKEAKDDSSVPDELYVYGKKKKADKDKALSGKKAKVVVLSAKKDNKDKDTNVETTKKVDLFLTVEGKIKYVINASKDDSNTVEIDSLDKPVVVVYK